MRIAYLTQSYPPMISGAAIVAEQLAKEMAERGHQILIIAASDRGQPYHSLQKNLTILRLRSTHNPMRVGQRFLLNPQAALMKALREFRPDVIHSHDPLQMSWVGINYSKRARIPITLTIHQLPWFVASYLPRFVRVCVETVLWGYARWLTQNFTSLIVPTQTIANIVATMTALKPKTISYGLDLQTFHPPLHADLQPAARKKWNLPPRVPLLLHTGRLDKDKNVDRVVRAAAPTLRESEAHLVIVGDGRQKNYLIHLCKDLGISERVHFTGFISKEKGLPEIYRMANLFLTASEIETQGIVLLEAAASGLPIVAVDATCISEIVRDGVNGFLVRAEDDRAMSEAIRRVLSNHEMAYKMGRESRKLAETHNNQRTYMEHEKLYNRMIRQTRQIHGRENVARARKWRRRIHISK